MAVVSSSRRINMSRLQRTSTKVVGAAILAPLSVFLQTIPPIFLTPWFMRIDFVAIPWILAWIIFDLKTALLCLVISAPLVGILGPYAGGLVGMVMKSVASVWMFLIPALIAHRVGGTRNFLNKPIIYIGAFILAIVARVATTIFFNFYFALPLFFNMTVDQIQWFFNNFPSFLSTSLGLVGLYAFAAETAFWNTIQGIVDLLAATAIGKIVLRRVSVK